VKLGFVPFDPNDAGNLDLYLLTADIELPDGPMSVLLAADDDDHNADFEPERLGLTARTPEL
jgi:plasmid stability protein